MIGGLVRRLPRQHSAAARAREGAGARRSSARGTTRVRTSAYPGPEFEWRDEAVRWFDQCLQGASDTGFEKEPRLAVYVRDWHPPDPNLETAAGPLALRGLADPRGARDAPFTSRADHRFATPRPAPTAVDRAALRPVDGGVEAGFWWGEVRRTSGPTDAYSLVYDSPPLDERRRDPGPPAAPAARLAPTRRSADWFARLSRRRSRRQVTNVTGAGLNGAQRESSARPAPLEPGRVYPLEVELHFTSWVFPRGHRIRVAVSNAHWPMIWPTPYAMTTTLELGGTERLARAAPGHPLRGAARPSYGEPRKTPEPEGIRSEGGTWPGAWTICRDEVRQSSHGDWNSIADTTYPWGRVSLAERLAYDVADAHPEAASVSGQGSTDPRAARQGPGVARGARGAERREELLLPLEARAVQGRGRPAREDVAGNDPAGSPVIPPRGF